MHVSLEGNWQNFLLYLCAHYGCDMVTKLNERVRVITANCPLPVHPLRQGVVVEYESKAHQRPLLRVATYTAEEFEIFIMISPFALKGLISSEHFATWMRCIRADALLATSKHHLDLLPRLTTLTAEAKEVRSCSFSPC